MLSSRLSSATSRLVPLTPGSPVTSWKVLRNCCSLSPYIRLTFCFSRICLAYSDALRWRPPDWPCWPGGYARRSTGHFSVRHLVPLRNSLVASRRQSRQLGPTYLDMAQTRRFLGGRHPLWGIGVTSRMETTRSPTEASAWMADSRPLPGPWTRTCTRRRPRFIASRPQFSAATVAANGVDFLEPLNPALPADPHARVLPRMSVIVISRLLNVAEMWAMPSDSTTFLARLALGALAGAGAVILLLRHFLLARDGAARPLLGARVGVSPLAPHRETPAVADAAIAADVHQPLDVHRDFGTEGALHLDRPLDDLA